MKIIKSILLLAGLAGFVNGQYRKDTLKLTSINGRPCDTALVEDWEPSGDKDSWMIRPCGVNACDEICKFTVMEDAGCFDYDNEWSKNRACISNTLPQAVACARTNEQCADENRWQVEAFFLRFAFGEFPGGTIGESPPMGEQQYQQSSRCPLESEWLCPADVWNLPDSHKIEK